MKNKIVFAVLLIAIFGLSALAVYLAQALRTRDSVSPAAPQSIPAAATPDECQYSFTVPSLECYQGTCEEDGQCKNGLVCDSALKLCVNPNCRESEDCICDSTDTTYSCNSTCTTDEQCEGVNSDYICDETTSRCRHYAYPEEVDCQPEETLTTTYSCNSTCTTDEQCEGANASYICYSQTDTCRHSSYPTEDDCMPPATASTSPSSSPSSPASSTPTLSPSPTNTSSSTASPTGSPIASSSPNPSQTLPPDVPVTGVGLPTALGITASAILIGLAIIFAF